MPNNTNQNPLKDFVDPTTVPAMTVDGLTVNKSFAYTGVVDTLNTGNGTLVSPQSTKAQPLKSTKLPNRNTGNTSTSYWTSPTDSIGSKAITAVQFQLKNPNSSDITIFNYVAFDITDVPSNWSLYYQDLNTGIMRQATDVKGNYVGGRTTGVSNGAWIHNEVFLQPIGTTLLELRFDRNVPTLSSVGSYAPGTQYSFELRNLDLKMVATKWNDVPSSSRVASVNVLGFTELYAKRQKDSSQIQTPTVRTANLNSSSYWRSQAQPFGDSIVSLYIDLGSVQTIDSIYLDPLYSGTSCNIYCSSDTTINTEFYCSRKMGTFTQKDSTNPAIFYFNGPQAFVINVPGQTGMSIGTSTNSGLVTPNNIQIIGTQSWSMGISFAPNTGASSGTLVDQYVTASSSHSTTLSYATSSTNYIFTAICNGTSTSVTVPKISKPSGGWTNFPYTIVWGFNATTNQVFIYVDYRANNIISSIVSTASPAPITDSTPFTIGNSSLGGSPTNGYLTDFWIKQDAVTLSTIKSYINNTRNYINSAGPKTSARGDYRSLLMSTLNSANVFYGPNSSYFSAKQWTPAANSLSVRSGTYQIPQFTGQYVKIDFTNLSPQVYPVIRNYQKETKRLPIDVVKGFVHRENQIPNARSDQYLALSTNATTSSYISRGPSNSVATPAGATVTQVLNGITQADLNASQIGSSQSTSLPNSNSIIIDPTSNSNYSAYLGGYPNASDDVAIAQTTLASFTPVGTHNYETDTVTQSWNQGYFAGLKAIGFYKTNPVVIDDTEFYTDMCTIPTSSTGTNGSIFASTTFTQPTVASPGYTSSDVGNTLISQGLSSYTPVTAFQMSAITSDWNSTITSDKALLQNTAINSYLTYTNCPTPTQISTFALSSGVWAFSPTASGSYGPKTGTVSITSSGTGGMRCSAAARIYLPNTNTGTYQLNLWATVSGTTQIVASKTYSNIPLQNFTDLQIAWNVPLSSTITNLQVEVLQINSNVSETFYLTMLSPFTHPIGWFCSPDGINYSPVSPGIGNPNSYTSLGVPTNSFYIKAISYTSKAFINSVVIRPQYLQNAYTPSVSIDYAPDPRTNEVPARVSVYDHPMFKVNTNFFPASMSLGNVSLT